MKFYENISKITVFKSSIKEYSGYVNLILDSEDSADLIMNIIRVRNDEKIKPYHVR